MKGQSGFGLAVATDQVGYDGSGGHQNTGQCQEQRQPKAASQRDGGQVFGAGAGCHERINKAHRVLRQLCHHDGPSQPQQGADLCLSLLIQAEHDERTTLKNEVGGDRCVTGAKHKPGGHWLQSRQNSA